MFDKSLELDDLSNLRESEDQQYPFQASFWRPTTLHPMAWLAGSFLCYSMLSMHSKQSSFCFCVYMSIPSHPAGEITTSMSRRESELTSSFALTLQIQWIIVLQAVKRSHSYFPCFSCRCSITLLTQVEYT